MRTEGRAGAARETVLVVGGSFAGLAAAWWMDRLGYAGTVVEIADGIRRGGTPVNIRDGVIEVVRRMGLLDGIVAASLPPRPVTFLDREGLPLPQAAERMEEAEEEYEIERDVLLDMLYERVEGRVEFIFGDSVAGLVESADDVAVRFRSGGERSFSLVLGCDGTHSGVRRIAFGDERSFVVFLENYFSLTIVDRLLLPENTAQMLSVPGRTVMLNAYNGKTDIAFCFYSDQEIDYDRRRQDLQRRMIREHFEGHGWRTGELLDEMSGSESFYFDKLCQVRMEGWTKGRIALVGDAGYCPSPAAGMGGSMAILGAAALGEALEKHGEDFSAAFREYERSFRPTVERIQADAVEQGLKLFMPQTEEALVERNLLLGLG